MSNKRHHAEWLSLVEVSGPFLTMPVVGTEIGKASEPIKARFADCARGYSPWP